jgi:hypothetical protein
MAIFTSSACMEFVEVAGLHRDLGKSSRASRESVRLVWGRRFAAEPTESATEHQNFRCAFTDFDFIHVT